MKAAILGATGLIGNHLLNMLIHDNHFDEIILIVRRDLKVASEKVTVRIIDFSNLSSFREAISGIDTTFCCIGTTKNKVKGNLHEYRTVDYNIPVNAAKFAAESGAAHFLLVSSVGADAAKSSFYLKLKGEVEDTISSFSIPSISIFRPSLLLGTRKEFRFGEGLMQILLPLISFLIPQKYKPIKASKVAEAMITAAKQKHPGQRIFHYKDMIPPTRPPPK